MSGQVTDRGGAPRRRTAGRGFGGRRLHGGDSGQGRRRTANEEVTAVRAILEGRVAADADGRAARAGSG
ncbi:hypothetical protein DEF23_10430 [Marinitenerispora sediminis]|uniref:Uncharacterized protein n=1 Tax=Marinitenerispora sediminis TaxID=1931232 RepID=A0A368T7I0_9ACTN|nr:hypothetical protein DEF28_14685 [Marinitenerispora sediminis]RCV57641.1 hypothetical protein DEF23_10430 [Marinitenerispora sediminis]RCV59936.1 hypothetical protein DEF24_08485 [Marinitenerispora sediminis]